MTTVDSSAEAVAPATPAQAGRWTAQWKELYAEVITTGLCTGCAGCVVTCPHDVIGYEHEEGKYIPFHLEEELGLKVFVRQGKRLSSLTPAGVGVVATARRALAEIGNLKRVADEFRREDSGTLTIATTHTQARYVLPKVLLAFANRYPKVKVVLHQGNPRQVAEQTAAGEADVGIATEALADYQELATLPCYTWNRCVLVPVGHPLAKHKGKLTLEAIARHPIVTYDSAFTGRSQINAAFASRGLAPNVVLSALDADVIKTYVELGMGVGIVASMAFDPARDRGFVMLEAGHLFEPSTTRLALRRGVFLRGYVYAFIALFAPKHDRAAVDAALASQKSAT